MIDTVERTNFYRGLAVSITAHFVLILILMFNLSRTSAFQNSIVYSITIEGGKNIGGVAQIQKSEKETPQAPVKNVSTKSEEVEVKPVIKEEKPETQVEKPEVSLAEKKPEPKVEEKKKVVIEKKEQKKEKPKADPMADVNKDYQKALQRYLGESTEAGGKGFGAAKVGGKGMGGGVLMPPEFFVYRQLLRNRIKSGWKWYDTRAALNTWVTFKIARDGTISDVGVAESSGNREYDESVLRAIYKASPLPPPPEKVYDVFRDVKMSFDPRE